MNYKLIEVKCHILPKKKKKNQHKEYFCRKIKKIENEFPLFFLQILVIKGDQYLFYGIVGCTHRDACEGNLIYFV